MQTVDMENIQTLKVCHACLREKSISVFYIYKQTGKPDSLCKACRKERTKFRSIGIRRRYTAARSHAKSRGHEWDISFMVYKDLIEKASCTYCGGELPTHGSGLDRIDNTIDYIEGNVVTCCTICNRTRNNVFTTEEMITVIGPAIRRVRMLRQFKAVDQSTC